MMNRKGGMLAGCALLATGVFLFLEYPNEPVARQIDPPSAPTAERPHARAGALNASLAVIALDTQHRQTPRADRPMPTASLAPTTAPTPLAQQNTAPANPSKEHQISLRSNLHHLGQEKLQARYANAPPAPWASAVAFALLSRNATLRKNDHAQIDCVSCRKGICLGHLSQIADTTNPEDDAYLSSKTLPRMVKRAAIRACWRQPDFSCFPNANGRPVSGEAETPRYEYYWVLTSVDPRMRLQEHEEMYVNAHACERTDVTAF